jgi:hypothetical protein
LADPKVVLMGLSLVVAILALWVALRNFKTGKKSLENNLNLRELEYTNTYLVNLSTGNKDGQVLNTDFQITNHGEKTITLTRVWINGRATTNVSDEFGVLYDSKSSYKPKPIEGGATHSINPRFVIGDGDITRLSIYATLELLNSNHQSISINVPVDVTIT